MPLNATQQHLLDSFFGVEGDYSTIIREYTGLEAGIKSLYLQRAITMSRHDFLASLDKLYPVDTHVTERAQVFEVIRSLKFINELYFNHSIHLMHLNIDKPVLAHCFDSISPPQFLAAGLGEFQASITAHVQRERLTLNSEQTHEQMTRRIRAEKSIVGDASWRLVTDLPIAYRRARASASASLKCCSIFRLGSLFCGLFTSTAREDEYTALGSGISRDS